jgi:glucose 1-dehydrogenase
MDVPPTGIFRVDGRRALVTGASRGIGRAIAIGLAAHGADVLVHYNQDEEAAADTLRKVVAAGGKGHLLRADLTEPAETSRLAAEAIADGDLDILILNAAIQERRVLAEVDRALFERHINANFWSALMLIKSALPAMSARHWGRIVAIGSVQQVRPNPNLLVYAGLKSALSTVMTSLAKAEARNGVTCNTVAPGLIDTDRSDDIRLDKTLYQSILDRIPAGAAGESVDCVGAVLLLCSEAGRYITGIDLLVDGGLHLP